jgi:tRNA nucleotidyltransferase (CCA-adding enzyme)
MSSLDTYPRRDAVIALAKSIRQQGGRALIVGGANRDALLGCPVKDLDLEVYGLEAETLHHLLQQQYTIKTVGVSFGVYHIPELQIDVALPRKETAIGLGHRDFSINCDPYLSIEQAALRRDFTINAIYHDPLSEEWLDPWNGLQDLRQRILHPVSPRFMEDPLRVLRGMQFAARFDLQWSDTLIAYSRQISQDALAIERIEMEWKKMLVRGIKISRGMELLRASGWIRFYPELEALIDCPQDPQWHPEGDVWQHTLHCLDALPSLRTGDEHEDWVIALAVLCHDMGKPVTTEWIDGHIRSYQHESRGVPIAESFLQRITRQKSIYEQILPLVACHMLPYSLYKNQASDKALRKLALKVGRMDRLMSVVHADLRGRPPLPAYPSPELEWLEERLQQLNIQQSPPLPILLGRHLIPLGFTPGKPLGYALQQAFEAQLSGEFDSVESGIAWIKRHVEVSSQSENP